MKTSRSTVGCCDIGRKHWRTTEQTTTDYKIDQPKEKFHAETFHLDELRYTKYPSTHMITNTKSCIQTHVRRNPQIEKYAQHQTTVINGNGNSNSIYYATRKKMVIHPSVGNDLLTLD